MDAQFTPFQFMYPMITPLPELKTPELLMLFDKSNGAYAPVAPDGTPWLALRTPEMPDFPFPPQQMYSPSPFFQMPQQQQAPSIRSREANPFKNSFTSKGQETPPSDQYGSPSPFPGLVPSPQPAFFHPYLPERSGNSSPAPSNPMFYPYYPVPFFGSMGGIPNFMSNNNKVASRPDQPSSIDKASDRDVSSSFSLIPGPSNSVSSLLSHTLPVIPALPHTAPSTTLSSQSQTMRKKLPQGSSSSSLPVSPLSAHVPALQVSSQPNPQYLTSLPPPKRVPPFPDKTLLPPRSVQVVPNEKKPRKPFVAKGRRESLSADEAQLRRRERNRVAAANCRMRKITLENTLRSEIASLQAEHTRLFRDLNVLQQQLVSLKKSVIDHGKKGCHVEVA